MGLTTKQKLGLSAIVFLLSFLLYTNTLSNGYAIDDGMYTNKNSYVINGFKSVNDIFNKGSLYGYNRENDSQYRPLVLLDFMAETAIFGQNPHINHFFNVLFYAVTCVLLLWLLVKILPGKNPFIALAATLLFVFHPIHTEVVANIKSRDEILGFLFGLISFYFILVFAEKGKKKDYLISVFAFFLSVFCKENCLTFVLIIPLLLYFFTLAKLGKILTLTIPFVLVCGIYIFARQHAMDSITFTHKMSVFKNSLMAAQNGSEELATSFSILGKYIYMTFIPYPLSWDYSYNQIPIVSWSNIYPILILFVCIALAAFAIRGFRKKSLYSFAILFFGITIFLSSNLVIKLATTFAERFLYVPSLGLCLALPVLVSTATKFSLGNKNGRNIFFAIIILILVVYAFIVIPRNAEWKDNYSLDKSACITTPNSARVHLSMADDYFTLLRAATSKEEKQRLFRLNLKEIYRAIEIYPTLAEAYYNLGVSYYMAGIKDSAASAFQKTLQFDSTYAKAANDLGMLFADKLQYGQALKLFQQAARTDTSLVEPFINAGALFQRTGNYTAALQYYSHALKKDPNNRALNANIDRIMALQKNTTTAP